MRTRSAVKKLLANKKYNLEDDGLSDVSTISVLSEPSKTDYNSASNRNKLYGKKVENILKNVDNNNKKCNNPKNKIAKVKRTTRIRVPRMSQFFRQLDNYKMFIYIILFVFIITMGTFFDYNWIKQNNIKLFNIEYLYDEIQTLKLKLKRIYSNTNTDHKHQCCEINRKYIVGLNKKLSWISSYIGFTPNGKNIKDFYDYWTYENMNNLTNQIFNLQSDLNQLNNTIRIGIQHVNNQIMEYTKLNIQKPKYQLDQRVLDNITYINNKLSEIKNKNIIIDKDINNIYNELQILDQTQQALREMIWSMIQRNEDKVFHNSKISTYKNLSNENLTNFQNIEVIIQKMIQQRLDLDDTSMIDWAQVSLGSNVIEPKKNKTCLDQFNNYYVPNIINILKWSIDKVKYHIFYKYSDRDNEILYNNHKYCINPNTIITSNHKSIGECLTIKTGSQIIIKLSVPINITMIGIDHILYPLDYDHGQTVPRNISVYCINDIIKEKNYRKQNYIGSFIYKYPQPSQKLQLFNVKNFLVCNKAKFIIHSSYGTNKVCIYRLRIFGYPVFPSYLNNNNIQIINQYIYKYIKIVVYHLYKWLIYLSNKLFEINNDKQNNSSNNYYINKNIENYNIPKRNSYKNSNLLNYNEKYKNPTLYNNIKIYENSNQTIKKNRQRIFL